MRMDKGKPFMHVPEEAPLPDIDEIKADAERARAGGFDIPVFSEMFLYPRLGKDDARFILGVAEEYEHVIKALGPEALRAVLDVNPRLVQRLGTGSKLAEWLTDARSDESLRRSEESPTQVILDDNAAEAIWELLHGEYTRTFNPEQDMDRDHLRAYHDLTDSLGNWEQGQREKEQARLPEKLEQQKARKAALAAKKAARANRRERIAAAIGSADRIASTDREVWLEQADAVIAALDSEAIQPTGKLP